MNTNLVALAINQLVTSVRDNLSERLYTAVDASIKNNTFNLDTIKKELDKMLNELPKVNTTPVPQQPQVMNNSVVSQPRSSGTRVPSDVLKDSAGNPIQCTQITKKSSQPCRNKAKVKYGDHFLCGLHASSATKAQSDPNKAPKVNGNSFAQQVGITPASQNSFANITLDTNDAFVIKDENIVN